MRGLPNSSTWPGRRTAQQLVNAGDMWVPVGVPGSVGPQRKARSLRGDPGENSGLGVRYIVRLNYCKFN